MFKKSIAGYTEVYTKEKYTNRTAVDDRGKLWYDK